MKRLEVTIFKDEEITKFKNLEALGAYAFLGSVFFDQGVSCPYSAAIDILSEHFQISQSKAESLIEFVEKVKTDLDFMIYKRND